MEEIRRMDLKIAQLVKREYRNDALFCWGRSGQRWSDVGFGTGMICLLQTTVVTDKLIAKGIPFEWHDGRNLVSIPAFPVVTGSMHIADLMQVTFGANGIVAARLPWRPLLNKCIRLVRLLPVSLGTAQPAKVPSTKQWIWFISIFRYFLTVSITASGARKRNQHRQPSCHGSMATC